MPASCARDARRDSISQRRGAAASPRYSVATTSTPRSGRRSSSGAVWGMIGASWRGDDQPPADAEERLAQFADLLATAVSNAAMRGELAASRARVIAAADESRRRIERDLHDGAQQQLVT